LTVEEVPNPRYENGGWVTDMADILNTDTETELNGIISHFEETNGSEIAVVTVFNTPSTESSEVFATELFNYWGIGKANINNGILLLISLDENYYEIQIRTGTGLKDILPDQEVQKIIDTQIVPQYKHDRFNIGTLKGTNALIRTLNSEVLKDPASEVIKDQSRHWSIFPLVGLGITLLAGGIVRFRQQRNKVFVKPSKNIALQRIDNREVHCAKCHKPMERTKDIDLTSAQLVAKKLGAINYRGYKCPSCSKDANTYSIVAYYSSSDRFEDCPECKELTVVKTGEVLETATRNSKGKFLSKKKCHHCDYQTEKITDTPRFKQSKTKNIGLNNSSSAYTYYDGGSSSGGSSGGGGYSGGFGGGGSDGGGAGGDF